MCGGLNGWAMTSLACTSSVQVAACAEAGIPDELLQRWAFISAERDTLVQRACLEERSSGVCSWMMVAFWTASWTEDARRRRFVEMRMLMRVSDDGSCKKEVELILVEVNCEESRNDGSCARS